MCFAAAPDIVMAAAKTLACAVGVLAYV